MRSSSVHTRKTLGSCYDSLHDLLEDRDECERLVRQGGNKDQMKRRLYWIKHFKFFEAIIKKYPDLHHEIPEEERGSLSAELQDVIVTQHRRRKIDSERLALSSAADDEDLLDSSSENDDDLDAFIVDDVVDDDEYVESDQEESEQEESDDVEYHKDGRRIYQIDKILQRRVIDGAYEYLIRWEGYSPKFDTWEPDENILDRSLVDTFNKTQDRKSSVEPAAKRSNAPVCICSIYRN